MRKKIFKKLSRKGLILIGLLFFVGLICIATQSPAIASVGAMLPLIGFGMATAVPVDSSNNLRTVPYTHSSATEPGDIIVVNSCVLVAVNTIGANAENIYIYSGRVTIPKAAPLVISVMDQIYWDAGDSNVNKTASGNIPCGYCVEDAASADTTVTIMLQATDTSTVENITLANGKMLLGGADGNAAAQDMSGDGTITNAGVLSLAETMIKYATVALSNAEIKALRAAPKTLVAAQGTNKVIELISALLRLDYGSNVLTESADNLAIRFTDGSGAIVSQAIEATGFIDASADTITNALPKIDAIVAQASAANKALVLHNTGDGEYAGNAGEDTVMVVKIAYRVHDLQ